MARVRHDQCFNSLIYKCFYSLFYHLSFLSVQNGTEILDAMMHYCCTHHNGCWMTFLGNILLIFEIGNFSTSYEDENVL